MGRVKKNFQVLNLGNRACDGGLGGRVVLCEKTISSGMVEEILSWS